MDVAKTLHPTFTLHKLKHQTIERGIKIKKAVIAETVYETMKNLDAAIRHRGDAYKGGDISAATSYLKY